MRFCKLSLVLSIIVFIATSACSRDVKEPARAMWVWDTRIPASDKEQQELFKFCKAKNVNRLYLAAQNFNRQSSQKYRRFNRRAHKKGIYVHALGGDPRWAFERYHKQGLRWVQSILTFNRDSRQTERFDGIQNSTLVYFLGKPWEQNKKGIVIGYLELSRKIKGLIGIEEIDIAYGCDVPFWFDEDPALVVHWNNRVKPSSFHILDICDSATIMDYRNFAVGPNGSIELVKDEIRYADSVNKKIYIGQETTGNQYPVHVSFSEMSEEEMEGQIKEIVKAYSGNSSFAGISMHNYASYKKLIEK